MKKLLLIALLLPAVFVAAPGTAQADGVSERTGKKIRKELHRAKKKLHKSRRSEQRHLRRDKRRVHSERRRVHRDSHRRGSITRGGYSYYTKSGQRYRHHGRRVEIWKRGHYITRYEMVADRGYYEQVWVEPVFRIDHHGHQVLVQPGFYQKVWVPGHSRRVARKVWIPGAYIRHR